MCNTFAIKKSKKKVILKLNSGGITKKYKSKMMISMKEIHKETKNNFFRKLTI
jgi:hypothetical protein